MRNYRYTVYVDDNFHYKDESERYKLGEYGDCASAVKACQQLVDEFLDRGFRENTSAEEVHKSYLLFGEDPYILSDDPDCRFSARDYARRRVDEMSGRAG